LFRWLVARPVFCRAHAAALAGAAAFGVWLARIIWTALVLVVLSGAAWLVLLAAGIGDHPSADLLFTEVVPAVLGSTRFGHLWLVRLAMALLLAALIAGDATERRRSDTVAAALALGLLASLAWVGHGGATEGFAGDIH